ncbi:helix-turn-helix domain-containing protein [Thermomonospora cellulosilytica]|uniref:Transcriptional regulator with XRE-family HTH domain n=1 Tax=Thermomonospora cellulosilytica TaxID=1411118 RepID=A0A7W3N4Z7_9ACTN|nr:helix-turn-helix transcriptional regulator [Thermomonospora cellulosilytica]MBA9007567.1 transcriptional regulator with XRE-family HTH domain [Thermomonospora cellulosilytica]
MPSPHRPSVRYRRIGSALRQAREDAGLTMGAAARRYGRSQGWFSNIENGLLPIRLDELIDLLDFYGVQDPTLRESLCHLARQGRRKNWTHQFRDRISPAALDLASLENDSASIRTFQPNLVPGLLQNEDYARSVIETGLPTSTRDNDELVAFRMARQAIWQRVDPPVYQVVISESVLHQLVGGRAVMRAQLVRLAEAAMLDHVTLRILPFTSSAYLWINVPFDLITLRPPGHLTVAVAELVTRSVFMEDDQEVTQYEEIFTHLLPATLDETRSWEVIDRILSGL